MAVSINSPIRLASDTPRLSLKRNSRRYFGPNSSASYSEIYKKAAATTAEIGRCRPIRGVTARSEIVIDGDKAVMDEGTLVTVPPHPLIKHLVSLLTNEQTPSAIFKNAVAELGRLLIYEASRDWLPIAREIPIPSGIADVEFVDPQEPVLVIPILRAGLALAQLASTVLPVTKTFHLGIRKDEITRQPSIYLNNLPNKFPGNARIFLVDPVLATGGTIVAALDLLKDRGLTNKQIKVISAIAAPPALERLNKKFKGLHIYTGMIMIDAVVNEKGIVLGLGDFGDQSFGT